MSRFVLRYLLIQEDDQMRLAGREIFEEITAINQTREHAATTRSRLLRSQLLVIGAALALFKKRTTNIWAFGTAIVTVGMMILYRICQILPLLSTHRSDHISRVYVKLQGIADFDSASSMLRAISRHLHFRDFPQLGVPTSLAAAMPLINYLPSSLRDSVYSQVGASEATDDVSSIFDAEKITDQIVAHFPAHRKYPAVAIRCINSPLYRDGHPLVTSDTPHARQATQAQRDQAGAVGCDGIDGMEQVSWFLRENTMIELYHMADPNQDQLMIRHMAYFRLKFIKLTEAYRKFLLDSLSENGTIILVRCGHKWPCTKIAKRHYFQSGAV
ncbi:hypothetical protein VTN31DRAFT_4491 [Thermomyces dupontii]|uniref:uncharacterized protein n=1 Tax=Talaromyces thermophilus TaxID=28565 RepID=UPI003741EC9B